MKSGLLSFFILLICLSSCNKNNIKSQANNNNADIVGSWEMIYAEITENDSVQIKDLTQTRFIKIINKTHFAFFNQEASGSQNYYGGAGTYTLNGNDYIETLNFTAVEAIKNHSFSFKIKIQGDTLIQSGLEEIKEAGISREITEKYIRISSL
jgi:hypothetical protein